METAAPTEGCDGNDEFERGAARAGSTRDVDRRSICVHASSGRACATGVSLRTLAAAAGLMTALGISPAFAQMCLRQRQSLPGHSAVRNGRRRPGVHRASALNANATGFSATVYGNGAIANGNKRDRDRDQAQRRKRPLGDGDRPKRKSRPAPPPPQPARPALRTVLLRPRRAHSAMPTAKARPRRASPAPPTALRPRRPVRVRSRTAGRPPRPATAASPTAALRPPPERPPWPMANRRRRPECRPLRPAATRPRAA